MRHTRPRLRGSQQGFSLIELLLATAILGIVMSGLVALLSAGQRAYSRGSNTVDAQQNARVALDRMAREIREAGYHPAPPDTSPSTCPPGPGNLYPSGGGTDNPCWRFYPIVGQTSTGFTLQFDWNGDGASASSGRVNDALTCPTGAGCRGERVTYSLSGTNMKRQQVCDPGGAQVVASGIDALALTYLKADGTSTTNRELIRSVQIRLTVRRGSTASCQSSGAQAVEQVCTTMVDTVRIRGR
jgi:type IV pilus assembly protein PilW